MYPYAMRTALLLLLSAASYGAACTDASPACTEWIAFKGPAARSLVYRNVPLDVRNEKIVRALVMVHGAGRDAGNYFRTALAAAFLAGALDNTVVIAPRFASNDARGCEDTLAALEVNWSCSGDSWRSGGTALNNSQLTSYDLTDEILKKLARKDVFPNLAKIVVAGHSAGGQYVNRYQMSNRVRDKLGVPVTYVVSNPSSYAYLDPVRPSADGSQFAPFRDGRNCTTFDDWPYGMKKRTGYTAELEPATMKRQLSARPVIYLLGEIDILPLGGFDSSCPAMAQGPTRLARGQAYAKYVTQKLGAEQKAVVVPLCGHNARCIFTAEVSLPIIFPK